ncbi:MAG: LysR family transcriptional regulator [Glaciimonas sp.]|nr:LysR family transcriptional regulator [Glaciimonas sp.]
MDQLAAMRAFRRVVESGSFTAAAAELNQSHTIVSRQIRQLETVLKAQLLNRTTRRFALTEAGQEYYERCKQILDQIDDAALAISSHQAQPSGLLRINAPQAFGTSELVHWLPKFIMHHPQLRVDLVCNDRFVDLIEEGFDVTLRVTRNKLADSNLIAKHLASSDSLLVASPEYLRQHGVPQTPSDLAQHNCLTYSLMQKFKELHFTAPDGIAHHITVQGSLQANTGIGLCSAAAAGLGIATTASFIAHDDIRRGVLVQVLPTYKLVSQELFVLYPQNRHLSPKVRAFVDFAVEWYRIQRWD